MRVTYSRELALKAFLDEEKIENFIPMRRDYIVKKGRRIRRLVPAVHNLVFIRSTRKRIDALKDKAGMNIPMRYITSRTASPHCHSRQSDAQLHSCCRYL